MRRASITTAMLALGALVAGPAHATLQAAFDVNGSLFTVVDNNSPPGTALDTDPTLGIMTLADQTRLGIIIHSSTATATPGTTSQLNSTALSTINTNPFAVTVTAAISATDFPGPLSSFSASGSGTFQNSIGATMQNSWYDSSDNAQGAVAGSCLNGAIGGLNITCVQPGTLVATSGVFTNTGSPNSYSFNFASPVTDPGLYSMTLTFQFTLPAASVDCNRTTGLGCPTLVSRGQAEEKLNNVPEPASLGLLGIGMLGLSFIAARRRR